MDIGKFRVVVDPALSIDSHVNRYKGEKCPEKILKTCCSVVFVRSLDCFRYELNEVNRIGTF